jgi:LuxR family maltose regulon positive regulatory protein
LTAALTQSLAFPFTLVSAPAGYGKTTLVSSWLRTGQIPHAWLSLDEGDNDPARFLPYFVTALRAVVPGIPADILAVHQRTPPLPNPALLASLVNLTVECPAPFALVLDDFQHIQDPAVLGMLSDLLQHMPPPMHLVVISRTDPALPLARLRGRNQLAEFRALQLRFSGEEVERFLNELMGLGLPREDLETMEARTEGWIAGLQLAALSMRGGQDTHRFVSELAGSHAYIMDYLVEEVLKLQPEGVRSFLLQTSILERMCGPLCSAVVDPGPTGPVDGQAMLEGLRQANLFVVSLDDDRRWYRYHQLFADLLNRTVEHQYPDRLAGLHDRASHWWEQYGEIPEAIRHATQAGDPVRAANLIEGNGCGLLLRGEVNTLQKWIGSVESEVRRRPWLSVLEAWVLTLAGQPERAEECLQRAEALLPPALEPTYEVRTVLGSLAAARAHRANLQGNARLAAESAERALGSLPDISLFSCSMRSVATSILAEARWIDGDLAGATHAYSDAVSIGRATDNAHAVILAELQLAEILREQGRLHDAFRTYSGSLRLATGMDGARSPSAAGPLVGLAGVAYEWNDLEAARGHLDDCLALCSRWGLAEMQAAAQALRARVELACGRHEAAEEAGRIAEGLLSQWHLAPRWAAWVRSTLARLWSAQGMPERAARLLPTVSASSDEQLLPTRGPEYLALAGLLYETGNHNAALALTDRLLTYSAETHRAGWTVELLVLQSLVQQAVGNWPLACSALERALSLAQGERRLRVFLDAGPSMAGLLIRVRKRGVGAELADEVLSLMRRTAAGPRLAAQPLIEPLTRRELEVLRLIEAGYSNLDMAAKLVISVATLKRHLSNIYSKLGVSSRTQALNAGRELRLIE